MRRAQPLPHGSASCFPDPPVSTPNLRVANPIGRDCQALLTSKLVSFSVSCFLPHADWVDRGRFVPVIRTVNSHFLPGPRNSGSQVKVDQISEVGGEEPEFNEAGGIPLTELLQALDHSLFFLFIPGTQTFWESIGELSCIR